MNNRLLTVVLGAYNHEAYIAESIESILKQRTVFNFSLIVCDDGSSDNTQEIIRSYQKKFPSKIDVVLDNKNHGLNDPNRSFLRTWRNVKTRYTAILEGDDYWTEPLKLQKQVDYLEGHERCSMSFTDSIIIDGMNIVIKHNRVPNAFKRKISQKDILCGFCPPANTVVIRTEVLADILKNSSCLYNTDYYLFSLLAAKGTCDYLDINTAAYRKHEGGGWSGKDSDYRDLNFLKVSRALEEKVLPENKGIVTRNISNVYSRLLQKLVGCDYLENALWSPQTQMLRSIRDTVVKIDIFPTRALSVDKNPNLEKMINYRWPECEVAIATYPEYDAQDLHQFESESFDIVFSHQVLEHIPKPWISATEMNRVLKKGGLGIHTTCAYNPIHGQPNFKDYYRFMPDGLESIFGRVAVLEKGSWGNKKALVHNLTVDDGFGELGGRRFDEHVGTLNDDKYPWHTWLVFQKL